jgi:Homeodomain-like domain-containing protein
MDMDERDALIVELHAQGLSTRAIAQQCGISQTRVQQIGTSAEADEDDEDWELDENELALLDAEDDGIEGIAEPITYVGEERSWYERGRGEEATGAP